MDKDPNGKCPNVRWQGLGYQDKAKNNKLRISLKKKNSTMGKVEKYQKTA